MHHGHCLVATTAFPARTPLFSEFPNFLKKSALANGPGTLATVAPPHAVKACAMPGGHALTARAPGRPSRIGGHYAVTYSEKNRGTPLVSRSVRINLCQLVSTCINRLVGSPTSPHWPCQGYRRLLATIRLSIITQFVASATVSGRGSGELIFLKS